MSNDLNPAEGGELKLNTPSPEALDQSGTDKPTADAATNAEDREATPASPNEGEDGTEAKAEDKPKQAPSRLRTRIDGLTRDKRNLQRTVSRLNQEIGRLKAERPPAREQFDDDAQYTAAQMRRVAKETDLERSSQATRDEVTRLREARKTVWDENVTERQADYPDFKQVFSDDLPVTEQMADFLVESEQGVDLAYMLGKDPQTCARLAAMSDPQSPHYNPREAERELARMEARAVNRPSRPVSGAPAPVPTVAGRKSGVGTKPLADVDFDEYVKRRREMDKANGAW